MPCSTLRADPSNPFDDVRPSHIGVYVAGLGTAQPDGAFHRFGYCDLEATINTWDSLSVTVTLPAVATSGVVYFRDRAAALADSARHNLMSQAAGELRQIPGECLEHMGLAEDSRTFYGALPDSACWIAVADISNGWFRVIHQPAVRAMLFDAATNVRLGDFGTNELPVFIERCTALRIAWDVTSDDPGPLDVELLQDAAALRTALPAQGSHTAEFSSVETLALTATNRCGTSLVGAPNVTFYRALTASPSPMRLREGGSRTLTVTASCPVSQDTEVRFSASNAFVRVEPSPALIPAGTRSVSVTVWAQGVGDPGPPASRLLITADNHRNCNVDVWIEAIEGRWRVRETRNGRDSRRTAPHGQGAVLLRRRAGLQRDREGARATGTR